MAGRGRAMGAAAHRGAPMLLAAAAVLGGLPGLSALPELAPALAVGPSPPAVMVSTEPADRDIGALLVDARQIIEEILVAEEGETAERGAVVVGVERRGPAARAGLEPADAIVELAGERVWVADDLWRILGARKLGSRLPISFVRDGEVRTSKLEVSGRRLGPLSAGERPPTGRRLQSWVWIRRPVNDW